MKIFLTRPQNRASPFAQRLRDAGYEPIEVPLLSIRDLKVAIPDSDTIDYLIFTSVNGVQAWQRATSITAIPCFVVGEATRRAAEQVGLEIAGMAQGSAASLYELLLKFNRQTKRRSLLHITGQHHHGDLAERLRAAGIETQRLCLYHAEAVLQLPPPLKEALQQKQPIILPFFSPRTVEIFFTLCRLENVPAFNANTQFLAFSENIATKIKTYGVYDCPVAKSPNLAAMIDIIPATHT
ncbi:MAG: uroporphyrinogen-III synthase [bacterium]